MTYAPDGPTEYIIIIIIIIIIPRFGYIKSVLLTVLKNKRKKKISDYIIF
jgi:hypothetical protein